MENNNNTQGELICELKSFNETLKRQQTIFYILRTGMLNGIGFVIGTSILAGVIISSLVYLLGDVAFIGQAIDQVELNTEK